MRHRNIKKPLGRTAGPRKSLIRNLAVSLILHGRIITTIAKARTLRPFVEQCVTRGKRATLQNRRLLIGRLGNVAAANKLLTDYGKRYASRNGGYTRILKVGIRTGDAGHTALIEFV